MSGSQCESQSQAREQQEQGLQGVGALASRKDQGEHERGMCEGGCEGVCVKDRERRKRLAPSIHEDHLHPAGWLGQLPRRQP